MSYAEQSEVTYSVERKIKELEQENSMLRSLLAEAIFWTDPSDDYFHSKTDLIKKVQKEFNMNQTGSIENGDMDSWLNYVKEKSE